MKYTKQKIIKSLKKDSLSFVKSVAKLVYLFIVIAFVADFKQTKSTFIGDIFSRNNTIASADWPPPPVPTLLYPDDNAYLKASSLYFDWSDEVSTPDNLPALYDFQLDTDENFNDPIFYEADSLTESRFPDTGFLSALSEGTYWWRVRSCRQHPTGVCSDYSTPRKVIVDDTAPVISIDNPTNGQTYTLDSTIDIIASLDDANPDHWILVARDQDGNPVSNFPDQSGGEETFSNRVIYSWDTSTVPEGAYTISFEAWDKAGNHADAVDPTSKVVIKIDRTIGHTITVSNSPERELKNKFINSDFKNGLNGWKFENALVSSSLDIEKLNLVPEDITSFVRLESKENSESYISQVIDNSSLGIRTISFYVKVLNFNSSDGYFKVLLSDVPYLYISANDNFNTGDWVRVDLYTVYFSKDKIDLKFEAKNAVVDIADIRTDRTVVDSNAVFKVKKNKKDTKTVFYKYFLNSKLITDSSDSELSFSLEDEPDNGKVYVWSEDYDGFKNPETTIYVSVDKQTPSSVSNLSINNNVLSFTVPDDGDAKFIYGYDIRFADSKDNLTIDNWDSLPKLPVKENTFITRPVGSKQFFTIDSKLLQKDKIYIGVRSIDRVYHKSDIESILYIKDTNTDSSLVKNDKDIVLNEFYQKNDKLFIELKNNSDEDIDLLNWQLIVNNKAFDIDKDLFTDDFNFDAVLPAHSYEVLSIDISDLGQSSVDTVLLLNNNSIIAQVNSINLKQNLSYSYDESVNTFKYTKYESLGFKNVFYDEDVKISSYLYSKDKYNARVFIYNAKSLNVKSCKLELGFYSLNSEDSEPVLQKIQKTVNIDSDKVVYDLYLASCSTNVCEPYEVVDLQKIKMSLDCVSEDGESIYSTEIPLTGKWKNEL